MNQADWTSWRRRWPARRLAVKRSCAARGCSAVSSPASSDSVPARPRAFPPRTACPFAASIPTSCSDSAASPPARAAPPSCATAPAAPPAAPALMAPARPSARSAELVSATDRVLPRRVISIVPAARRRKAASFAFRAAPAPASPTVREVRIVPPDSFAWSTAAVGSPFARAPATTGGTPRRFRIEARHRRVVVHEMPGCLSFSARWLGTIAVSHKQRALNEDGSQKRKRRCS